MIEHYNAFISYKHAKEDIKVAEAVQHGLEHFHIPGKIRKKTGKKRIERIFRDKEELPITSDLSENIAYALEHSDYLIVICSTNTKESMWVPREIEFFLRNHSPRQILTVLVNGEPQDVIPEILLHENRIVTNELGEQQTVRIPLEPLSCDYRMSIKKANKTELPRLASAIIGCSYDELMNRQRQYKMRRLTLAFSCFLAVALAFSGYMLYSRNQIKRNYLESLKNQSRYLASESEQFFKNEQRMTAIQLALAALPSDKNDERPVTAEAIRALTDATLAYTSLSGNNIYAEWSYQMPNPISEFMISPDGTYLAARDSSDNVKVWKTESHNEIFNIDSIKSEIIGMSFISDDKLLVWTDKTAILYDAATGNENWSYTLSEGYFAYDDIMIKGDGQIIFNVANSKLISLNASDGKPGKEYALPEKKGSDELRYESFKLSPDENSAVFTANSYGDNYYAGILIFNSGNVRFSEPSNTRIKDICWADASHIIAAYATDDLGSSVSMNNNSFLSTDHTLIECFDKDDLTKLWDYDFTSSEVNIYNKFISLPQTESVAYCNGNIARMFDIDTGIVLYEHNVNDSIVDISDRDGDGWPIYITKNGGLATPSPSGGTDAVILSQLFTDNISDVEISSGVYALQSYGKEIIYYGLYVSDPEWVEIDENLILSYINDNFYMDSDILAIITSENDEPTLTVLNPEKNDYFQLVIGEPETLTSRYKILGSNSGKLYIVTSDYLSLSIITVDLNNRKTAVSESFDSFSSDFAQIGFNDGKFIYTVEKGDSQAIVTYDVEKAESKSVKISYGLNNNAASPVYINNSDKVYFAGEKDCIIDLNNESVNEVMLPEDWLYTSVITPNESGNKIAVSDGSTILMVNQNGEIIFSIQCPGTEPIGMAFLKGKKDKEKELLVAYNNGSLYRYSLNDGEFIGKSDLSTYRNMDYTASFDFDYDNNILYVQVGMLTDVIDLESMYETACIENSLGHHNATDRFYTMSYKYVGENHIGYFKHYTTDELIQKGRDIIKNTELSDELKSEYGIK